MNHTLDWGPVIVLHASLYARLTINVDIHHVMLSKVSRCDQLEA